MRLTTKTLEIINEFLPLIMDGSIYNNADQLSKLFKHFEGTAASQAERQQFIEYIEQFLSPEQLFQLTNRMLVLDIKINGGNVLRGTKTIAHSLIIRCFEKELGANFISELTALVEQGNYVTVFNRLKLPDILLKLYQGQIINAITTPEMGKSISDETITKHIFFNIFQAAFSNNALSQNKPNIVIIFDNLLKENPILIDPILLAPIQSSTGNNLEEAQTLKILRDGAKERLLNQLSTALPPVPPAEPSSEMQIKLSMLLSQHLLQLSQQLTANDFNTYLERNFALLKQTTSLISLETKIQELKLTLPSSVAAPAAAKSPLPAVPERGRSTNFTSTSSLNPEEDDRIQAIAAESKKPRNISPPQVSETEVKISEPSGFLHVSHTPSEQENKLNADFLKIFRQENRGEEAASQKNIMQLKEGINKDAMLNSYAKMLNELYQIFAGTKAFFIVDAKSGKQTSALPVYQQLVKSIEQEASTYTHSYKSYPDTHINFLITRLATRVLTIENQLKKFRQEPLPGNDSYRPQLSVINSATKVINDFKAYLLNITQINLTPSSSPPRPRP